jgi:hypothetical protein
MRAFCTVLASVLLVAAGALAEARPDQGSASASGPGPARARHETAAPAEPPPREHKIDFLYVTPKLEPSMSACKRSRFDATWSRPR